MKKFFTLLLVSFAMLSTLSSQTLYEQNFEDGTLGDMISLDDDGLAHHSSISTAVGPGFTSLQLTSGNFVALATSYFASPASSSNYLITPAVEVTSEHTIVKWKAASSSAAYPDGYSIKVSTTGTEPADFTETLMTVDAEATGLSGRNVSLAAYVGQTIHIALHHVAYDGFYLFVDDFTVKVRDQVDVSLNKYEFDDKICLATTANATIDFTNEGIDAVTSLDVAYALNGEVKAETFDGLNIASGETQQLAIAEAFVIGEGLSQTVEFGITAVNGVDDANTDDNFTGQLFNVNPEMLDFGGIDSKGNEVSMSGEIAKGKAVVLDFFASWCDPCKNSTPELNTAYVNNQDVMTVIGITIEAEDNTDAIVNNLGWGATYPKFKYTEANRNVWNHYAYCLDLEDEEGNVVGGGSIPTFVMFCPNEDGSFEYSLGNTGFVTGMFNAYGTKAQSCAMPIGVEDLVQINDITVTPNPVKDMMKLEFYMDEVVIGLSANIVNALGQVVSTLRFDSQPGLHTQNIDMTDLNSGMYYVQFSKGNKIKSQKFIKL